MSQEIILFIILKLLAYDNAIGLEKRVVKNHLTRVAEAIHKHHTKDVPAIRLIALAYEESRFGYKEVQLKKAVISNKKACGIYQQVVKFSMIPTTCKKLQDPEHATKVAIKYLNYMIKRWNIKGTAKMDNRMCHYYSGNSCDDNKDKKLNKKDEAMRYAYRHRKTRKKALKFYRKSKKTKISLNNKKRVKKRFSWEPPLIMK